MKYLILFIILLHGIACANDSSTSFVLLASDLHTISESSEYQQNFQADSGYYVIKVKYDPVFCSIPAVVGAVPHYQAEFSIYQIINSKEVLVGAPFLGTFTFFKCFEDVPNNLINKAKQMEK